MRAQFVPVKEKSQGGPVAAAVSTKHRSCNICGRKFRAQSKFERFCESCKSGDEEYLYSDWLPMAG